MSYYIVFLPFFQCLSTFVNVPNYVINEVCILTKDDLEVLKQNNFTITYP